MTTIEGIGGTLAQFTATPGTTVERQGASGPPPPAIRWIAPADTSTVTGSTVGLLVQVTSQVSVTGVDLLDASNSDALIGHAVLGGFGWLVTWDSTGVADGARSIAAQANDSNGQTATVAIGVTVDNAAAPPSQLTCNLFSPNNGSTITGTAGFAVATTDNSPHTVTGVQLFANNVLIGSATLGAFGWGFGWDTSGVTNGTYTIRATATDETANTASSSITVQVQNVAAPTVTIAAPAAGSTISGSSVFLAALPRSTITISSVQFFLDNVLVGNAALSGFAWSRTCDSTVYTNGLHLLKVVATDTLSQTGELTVAVTVNNAAGPAGVLMPIQGGGPSSVIDNTDTTESTMGIRNWIANHTSPGDTILIPAGTYWVDGPIFQNGTRTITAADPANPYVFHRHTTYPYRIKPDLRPTISGVTNPAYNQFGRAGGWQYDALGGEAAIPTSLTNPNQTGTASGSDLGGYDATVVRTAGQVTGLRSLYGALWGPGDVGSVVQYLVESGANGSYQSFVQSVAADGKSLVFVTPVAVSSATSPGSEGTVAWCRHQRNAGWKVEHQTNDLLSFYVAGDSDHPWRGYQNAIEALVNAQMKPIVQMTDATACVLDHAVLQHANSTWHGAIVNFQKSYPLVMEFARCIETQSSNQIVSNTTLCYAWGAGEHGPSQLLNVDQTDHAMQGCTGHWDNKVIDGGTWQRTHHSLIDIEEPSKGHHSNVTIKNLNVGGPKSLVSYSTPIDGLTIKNVQSTHALVTNGTINSTTTMWASDGGKGYTTPGSNHLIDSCQFDTNSATDAITAINVNGLTVTSNSIPTSDYFLDARGGAHTLFAGPSPATTGTTLAVGDGTETKPLKMYSFGNGIDVIWFPFYAIVWAPGPTIPPAGSEIVRVTGIAGPDVFTIVRGQQGTTPHSIAAGWNIAQTSINVTVTGNTGSIGMLGQEAP